MKTWTSAAAVMIIGGKDQARILKTFQAHQENSMIMEKSMLILARLLKVQVNYKLGLIDSCNMKGVSRLAEIYLRIFK
jgi:hypothetical protein